MNDNRRMLARGLAFGVWAAVAAVALYWGLKLFVTSPPAPAHTTLAMATPAAGADLSRLLGVDAPPVVEAAPALVVDARFQLLGVVAPRAVNGSTAPSREGVALIAVDGKPAKAYRVGAVVEGDNILQSVQSRGAQLGLRGGPVGVALQLPPPALASSGTLPQPGATPQPLPLPQAIPVPSVARPGPRGFVVPGVVGAQPDVPAPRSPMGRPVLQ